MAPIIIDNLPANVMKSVEHRARSNDRTISQEIAAIVEDWFHLHFGPRATDFGPPYLNLFLDSPRTAIGEIEQSVSSTERIADPKFLPSDDGRQSSVVER